jgi:hypothetical protein
VRVAPSAVYDSSHQADHADPTSVWRPGTPAGPSRRPTHRPASTT